jgi:hypothetical protein
MPISHSEALAQCRNPADFELQARGIDSAANPLAGFEVRDAGSDRRAL